MFTHSTTMFFHVLSTFFNILPIVWTTILLRLNVWDWNCRCDSFSMQSRTQIDLAKRSLMNILNVHTYWVYSSSPISVSNQIFQWFSNEDWIVKNGADTIDKQHSKKAETDATPNHYDRQAASKKDKKTKMQDELLSATVMVVWLCRTFMNCKSCWVTYLNYKYTYKLDW